MIKPIPLRTFPTGSARALTALLITLFALACSPRTEEASAPAQEPATETTIKAPASAPLPAPGQMRVEISDLGVTVLANEAPRIELLQELASAAGFELVLGKLSGNEPETVNVYAINVSLTDALLRTLAGLPFGLVFGVDPEEGSSVLQVVRLGASQGRNMGQARSMRDPEKRGNRRAERKERLAQRLSSPEFAQEMAEKNRQRQEREAWASTQLDNSDPQVRAEAASNVDVEDADEFARLANLLKNDSSPEVRAAAVERLGDSDSAAARGYQLQALQDPSSPVVLNAIEALEFGGDESLIPQLQPLLQHPDPEVRERTQEAIDFLE